jgi:hypothetical protein
MLMMMYVGYRELHSCGALVDALAGTMVKSSGDLATFLLHSARDACKESRAARLPPLAAALGGAMVQFSLELGLASRPLVEVLRDATPAALDDDRAASRNNNNNNNDNDDNDDNDKDSSLIVGSKLNVGALFYDSYAPALHAALVRQADGAVGDALLPLMSTSSVARRGVIDALAALSAKNEQSSEARQRRRALIGRVCAHLSPLVPLVASPANGNEAAAAVRDDVLLLAQRLLTVDSRAVMTNESGSGFIVGLFEMLLARERPLAVKSRALSLLAGALRHMPPDDSRVTRMCTAVGQLVVNSLPLKSTDLTKGSALYSEYIVCVDRLLAALVSSRCVRLLKELYALLREGNEHAHAPSIDDALYTFVALLPDATARAAFDQCVDAAMDATKPSTLRVTLTRQLCVPLFAHLNRESKVMLSFSS